jgi:hypothetical protein
MKKSRRILSQAVMIMADCLKASPPCSFGRAHTPDSGKNGWMFHRFMLCGIFVISDSLN